MRLYASRGRLYVQMILARQAQYLPQATMFLDSFNLGGSNDDPLTTNIYATEQLAPQ